MTTSIITSLLLIGLLTLLYFNFAKTEATLDHFKLNKKESAPPNFMHQHYLIRNLLILLIVIIVTFHRPMEWYYYISTFLAAFLLYIPIHDGWYYVIRNRWKPDTYRGFWKGVDSNPGNKFMKTMNEPTTRKLLFVLALFCIIFLTTYDPLK